MSYYDSRKNNYISVPSVAHKYFTDNDPIEDFDGTNSEQLPDIKGEEESIPEVKGIVNFQPLDGKFTINDDGVQANDIANSVLSKNAEHFSGNQIGLLQDTHEKKILKVGNMEHFDSNLAVGASISSGGNLKKSDTGYCHEGNNLYTHTITGDNPAACLQKCKDPAHKDGFAEQCAGIVVQKNFPSAGKSTCFVKSRMSGDKSSSVKDPNCTSYYVEAPSEPAFDPIRNITKSDGDLANILNPPIPGQGSAQYDNVTTVWPGAGTVVAKQSDYNKKRQGKCNWSWDSTCIPDDISYYTNTQTGNSQAVIPLPDSCQSTDLNPNKPAIIKGSDGSQYVYVDGRKMKIPKSVSSGGSCYSAKYWIDPSTRVKCASGGTGTESSCPANIPSATDLSSNMNCFNEIPTISGNDAEDKGSVECRTDLRPSQRTLISDSLMKEANKWSTRGRKASLLYNTKTAVAASKYGEMSKSNSLLRKQVDNSQSNTMKLDNLDNSIYSQQRQVQIGNDETRRRNENVFLLKLLLTYILVTGIPMLLKKVFGESFKNGHVLLIFVFITIPFIYILGWNLYSIRNRSSMRWPLRNWPTGPLPDDNDLYEEEQVPTCPPPANKVAQCQEEADALEEEIHSIERRKHNIQHREKNLEKKEGVLQKRLCNVKNCIPGERCAQGGFTI